VAAELVRGKEIGLQIDEDQLFIGEGVRGMCELLGFDPLYVANEGKILMVVDGGDAEKALSIMHEHPLGKEASIIGEINDSHKGKAWLNTVVGGKRIIEMLSGQQLPRIC
jgi:hydrogenase expression/formation protein HypE